MITLIAESKSMNNSLNKVSYDTYVSNRPYFEDEAQKIMGFIRSNNIEELSLRLKISKSLASKALKYAYDFTDNSLGNKAIFEFSGEVFRALNVESLNQDNLEFASNHVLIISSLYGLLKPDDIIKPYRLNFSSDCSPIGRTLCDFWKKKVTIAVVNHIKSINETEILNLLPGEAMKYIDFKLLKHFASVVKPDFKILTQTDKLKTPSPGRLKELRGLMLRNIIKHDINNLNAVLNLSDMHFCIDPQRYKQDYPLYLCDE